MGMVKDRSNGHTETGITVIAMVAFLLRKWCNPKRIAVWTLGFVPPSCFFYVVDTIVIGGEKFKYFNNIHDNAPFSLPLLGTLNHRFKGMSRKIVLPQNGTFR